MPFDQWNITNYFSKNVKLILICTSNLRNYSYGKIYLHIKQRISIGRTDAEAEAPILWPPDVKSWLIRKDPDAWKDWRQEEKGTTEDEMVGWHHRLDGLEFEQAPGDGEGQWSLACCSPWGHRESDTTQLVNNNNSQLWIFICTNDCFWKTHPALSVVPLETHDF